MPFFVFFIKIRQTPRSTLDRSSAASDVYKRQYLNCCRNTIERETTLGFEGRSRLNLSLIHISEPTRLLSISYAVFCFFYKNTANTQIYTRSLVSSVRCV